MWGILKQPEILELVSAAGVAVLSFLLWKLERYLSGKIKGDLDDRILKRVRVAVVTAVRSVSQTYTDEIKAANADGKLTAAEKKEAKAAAVAKAKSLLSIKDLFSLFGKDDADSALNELVESTLHEVKAADPM